MNTLTGMMNHFGCWVRDSDSDDVETEYMEITPGRILIAYVVESDHPLNKMVSKYLYRSITNVDTVYEATIFGQDDYFQFHLTLDEAQLTLRRDEREWDFLRAETVPPEVRNRLDKAHQKMS
ncbi:MAG: hypothetical protein AAF226_13065 [Verrucomicrobiota bacterium]